MAIQNKFYSQVAKNHANTTDQCFNTKLYLLKETVEVYLFLITQL